METENSIRLIAFYLPQFHPIPENDTWWGEGFTEWTNVVKAKPLFPGHVQPQVPTDLGYYDLRSADTRTAQAELARSYGIHGFCYYHYWFNGKRLLDRPFDEVLSSGEPDFPFCLCWANENWTRRWDGLDNEVLIQQNYSSEDDREHIRQLIPAFEDKRYIKIVDRPLFMVYRAGLLPDPRRTAEIWREECEKSGIGSIYLASVDSIGERLTPAESGFDATVEFAPDWNVIGKPARPKMLDRLLDGIGVSNSGSYKVFNYDTLVRNMLSKPPPDHVCFRGVTPGWDNTARRGKDALIWAGATPEQYGDWLGRVIRSTVKDTAPAERLIFVNAWNEWAEGCHLEPDQNNGHGYLAATHTALKECS